MAPFKLDLAHSCPSPTQKKKKKKKERQKKLVILYALHVLGNWCTPEVYFIPNISKVH